MTLPGPLDRARTALLPDARQSSGVAARTVAPARNQARQVVTRVRSFARRGVGKVIRVGLGPIGSRLHALRADADITRDRLDRIETTQIDVELARQDIESNRIHGELLEGDVQEIGQGLDAVGQTLDAIGEAIAPTAGIAAAGPRFAELREQVNALERRVRRLDSQLEELAPSVAADGSTAPATNGARSPSPAEPAAVFLSERFNYVAFERRFRGDPADVLRTQSERYADLLVGRSPVVDIGCGRGELLEVLAARGVEAIGVEPDAGMVAEARARGLHIEHDDAISFLRAAEPQSIGALFSAHVVEHVPVEVMLEMIELAVTRLAPGGMFVAETPNPAALIVLGESFILDPTHVRPIHPALMAFLCETAGFRDVRLEFYAPADHHRLASIDDSSAPAWVATLNANVQTLNDVLFGPQDYADIATAPPA